MAEDPSFTETPTKTKHPAIYIKYRLLVDRLVREHSVRMAWRLGLWGRGVHPRHRPFGAQPPLRLGGGLGTTWFAYSERDPTAVLLTQCLPPPESLVNAFWSSLHNKINA